MSTEDDEEDPTFNAPHRVRRRLWLKVILRTARALDESGETDPRRQERIAERITREVFGLPVVELKLIQGGKAGAA